jgi:uncharacterized membrane protein
MNIVTTQDLFFLILAIVTGGVGIFLCWAMYEVASMLHQGNEMVTETREKISRIEDAISNLKDRFESSTNYLGMLAKGGKAIMAHFSKSQDDEEDEDEEEVRPKRRRR